MSTVSPSGPLTGNHPVLKVLDLHPLPLWVVTPFPFHIRFANRAAAALFGAGAGALLAGVPAPAPMAPLPRGPWPCTAADGRKLEVELHSGPIELDGELLLQVTAVEVSGCILKLQEERNRYKSYIDQSSQGIFCQEFRRPISIHSTLEAFVEHLRTDGHLSECNTAMAQMYGYDDPAALMGLLPAQLLDFEDASNIEYFRQFIENGFRITGAESKEFDRAGNPRYFLNNVIGIVEDGYLLRMWGTQKDITERKVGEEQLRMMANLVEQTNDMLTTADLEFKPLTWNGAAEKITGIPAAQAIGANLREVTQIHYGSVSSAEVRSTIDKTGTWRGEMFVRRPDNGKQVTLLTTFQVMTDLKGTHIGYIVSATDISEQKEIEEQLRFQATILNNVQDLIIITDLDFRIRQINGVAEQYYGITTAEATGRVFRDLIQLDFGELTREESVAIFQQQGRWKGEVSFINKAGERVYLLHTITYVLNQAGERIGIMAMSRDITERREAESRLRRSEQFYRALISDSLNGTLLADAHSNITFLAPSVTKILGYAPEDALGRNLFEFVHPDDAAWAGHAFQNELLDEPTVKSIVIRLRRKDGNYIWCNIRGHNLLAHPEVGSVVIYLHDDTERKKASDALRESEKRFRTLISNMQAGVILYDRDARIVMCNKVVAEVFQVAEEAMNGRNVFELIAHTTWESGQSMEQHERPLFRTLQTKKPVHNEVLGLKQPGTGEPIWALINTDPILDEHGDIIYVLCTLIDITERRRLEQKLLQEKISHQKQLTQATIDGQERERREIGKELHDNIGQQLTTIKLFLDMARSAVPEGEATEMLTMGQKGVLDVINEVRAISRSLVPALLNDLGLVDSLSELVSSVMRTQQVGIDLDCASFEEEGVADNKKLMLYRIVQEQLNNIMKHAEARSVSISLRRGRGSITLEVADDGIGFETDRVRRGLGLTNMRNRAELFGGTVTIASAPGQGCVLKVIVPDSE